MNAKNFMGFVSNINDIPSKGNIGDFYISKGEDRDTFTCIMWKRSGWSSFKIMQPNLHCFTCGNQRM